QASQPLDVGSAGPAPIAQPLEAVEGVAHGRHAVERTPLVGGPAKAVSPQIRGAPRRCQIDGHEAHYAEGRTSSEAPVSPIKRSRACPSPLCPSPLCWTLLFSATGSAQVLALARCAGGGRRGGRAGCAVR